MDTCDSARLDGTEEDNKQSILACKQAQSSLNLQWLGGCKIFAKCCRLIWVILKIMDPFWL